MRSLVCFTVVLCPLLCAGNAGPQPLTTDERIAAYGKLAASRPQDLQVKNQLAGAYIQKMRETTDFAYVDRAEKLVRNVLSVEPDNYEALRLRSEISREKAATSAR